MHKLIFSFCTVLVEASLCFAGTGSEIIRESGIRGGLVVHPGCKDGRLTSELYAGGSYIVHGLDTDRENISKARKYIRSLGLYGPVSADTFDGARDPWSTYRGEQGGVLMGSSADRGEHLFEIDLKGAPVYDGMAAAAGRVFLSLKDGQVVCFSGP